MISRIRLQQFRSYADASFEFGPGVNIIVGPNASGKTNLMEAVCTAALGGSFRARDGELPSIGAEWARLDAATSAEPAMPFDRVVKFKTNTQGQTRKSFEIDEKPYQRLSMQKTLPAVVFEPSHLLMLTAGPELRRNFLDGLIEQMVPGYATARMHYRRALTQRNALLKQGEAIARPNMFVWNLRLSELGGRLAAHRLRLIERLNEAMPDIHRELAGHEEPVEIEYYSKCDPAQYESSLLERLEGNISRDCMIGFTTSGPHRDDLIVRLRGHGIAETASRGENRTLVLALKVIELRLLEEVRGVAPLLLLDDVFSELDRSRRHSLTRYLETHQTFITTTDADIMQGRAEVAAELITLGER